MSVNVGGSTDGGYSLFPGIVNERRGFMDGEGKVVIEPAFLMAGEFHEGLARIQRFGRQQIGYIDRSGRWVWPVQG